MAERPPPVHGSVSGLVGDVERFPRSKIGHKWIIQLVILGQFVLILVQCLFKKWASFCFIFVLFNKNFTEKFCRSQRDSNSDRRSRRRARWPLDHHHGPKNTTLCNAFVKCCELTQCNERPQISFGFWNQQCANNLILTSERISQLFLKFRKNVLETFEHVIVTMKFLKSKFFLKSSFWLKFFYLKSFQSTFVAFQKEPKIQDKLVGDSCLPMLWGTICCSEPLISIESEYSRY